jgi:hypothetical protein
MASRMGVVVKRLVMLARRTSGFVMRVLPRELWRGRVQGSGPRVQKMGLWRVAGLVGSC